MLKDQANSNKLNEVPQSMEVPPQGSLGLLAYGYKGLLAWRLARKNALKKEEGEDGKVV